MILARVCTFNVSLLVELLISSQVIQNTVRTLAVTAMIIVVIGYSFPLFVSHAFTVRKEEETESSSISWWLFLLSRGSISASWCK